MKKKITKYGNSYVITFTKKEREIYNLKLGDIVDLGDMIVLKEKVLPQAPIKARRGNKR